MSIYSKFEEIYKRFNETNLDDAIYSMLKPIKEIIVKYNGKLNDNDLCLIGRIIYNITRCEEGLLKEEDNTHIFGLEAVNYLFWKIVHTANKANSGCNSREMLGWLKSHPAVGHIAFQYVQFDKETMDIHKQLLKDKKHAEDCYAKILSNIEKSLSFS